MLYPLIKKSNEINLLSKIKREIKGIKKIDVKEDIDEVFEISAVIIHIIKNIKPNFKDMAKLIPKYVAIPLPPLNLSHIG